MSLTPDMMPAWELREHLKDRDASIVILGNEISHLRAEVERLRAEAEQARAIALEEAARVAESFPARTHGALATAPYAAAEQAADEIAAAIRALAIADRPKT